MISNGIISPLMPLVSKDGKITPEWWRFFNTVFLITGGYQGGTGGGGSGGIQPVDLTTVYNLIFSDFGRTGPDYEHQIGDLKTYLATLPNPAGRIATLEAKVKQLETLLAAVTSRKGSDLELRIKQLETLVAATTQPHTDLTNLQREADVSRALTLGVRH